MLPLLAALDLGPWDLVRVDVPDYPGADATSARGSVLLAPPTEPGLAWRPEPVPEVDEDTGWTDAGTVAWEALDALDARPWHDAGYLGQGVKIAVFDVQWFQKDLRLDELSGAAEGLLFSHDCYAHRSCALEIDSLRPRFSWETGVHGVACAEVVRDVAPQAELHLVRVNGLTSLENAVDWAVREGIDLVSMSLSYFNEGFYDGTGAVNRAMDDLAAADILMVTSAGNYARQHWQEDFRDADGDGLHEFPWGSEYLPVYLSAGSQRVSVIWDDFGSCGATDFDAYAYDANGLLVGRATQVQDRDADSCSPVERLTVTAATSGWYYVQLHRAAGSPDATFDVMATSGEVWQAMAERSVADPATHPSVLAVGAVRAQGYAGNPAESFSSQGPTNAGLPKPEIAGPDGLTTRTYGPTGFYGTSASTPAVTAALALIMSADPTLSPYDAARVLVDSALSDSATWQRADSALGGGRARLPAPDAEPAGCGGFGHLWLLPPLAWLPLRRRATRDRPHPPPAR